MIRLIFPLGLNEGYLLVVDCLKAFVNEMPITITTAPHNSSAITLHPIVEPVALFRNSCPEEFKYSKWILEGSFEFEEKKDTCIYASSNSFIEAAVQAYSGHHHLRIRPEDVWFAILLQLRLYISNRSVELSSVFFRFPGEKELGVVSRGSEHSIGETLELLTSGLQGQLSQPGMRKWVRPSFTTTEKDDAIVATILMLSAPQRCTRYKHILCSGIPSVTLLGVREDWADILSRLEMLPKFGDEVKQWYHLLKPVVSRFVKTFDAPDALEIRNFWVQMVKRWDGPVRNVISGWLSAFCLWDINGRFLYQPAAHMPPEAPQAEQAEPSIETDDDLVLDGQRYGSSTLQDLPCGYTTIALRSEHPDRYQDAVVLGGSIALRSNMSRSQEPACLDTLQPMAGWFLYQNREIVHEQKVEK